LVKNLHHFSDLRVTKPQPLDGDLNERKVLLRRMQTTL